VLPAEGRFYRKAPLPAERVAAVGALYEQVYASFRDSAVPFVLYETTPVDMPVAGALDLAADTVDGTLWLALLARSPDQVPACREQLAGQVLTLGVVPDVPSGGRILPPGGSTTRAGAELVFAVPDASSPLPATATGRVARYRRLSASASADLLAEPGSVELTLPGREGLVLWEDLDPNESGVGNFPPAVDGDDAERLVTWVRIQVAGPAGTDDTGPSGSPGPSGRLRWAGLNATTVTQRTRIPREVLGRGTGEPDQLLRLIGTPVLVDSVRITVDSEPWQRVDDLLTAGAEVPTGEPDRYRVGYGPLGRPVTTAYTVDRDSGEVRFGDGLHGARPRSDALIEATYDIGGGREGLVAEDAITKGPLPAGLKVTNPVPTWGGAAQVSAQEAERQVRQFLHHRDRAVCTADFAEIARATPGADLARVEVLPLFDVEAPDLRIPGVVTVMVVPGHDVLHPDSPEPDQFLLELVCRHLDERRLITTEVHVRGPRYVPVSVSIGFDPLPGRDLAPLRAQVQAQVEAFLSALTGGLQGQGWPLATAVERLELWAVGNRVDGVARVNDVRLTGPDGAPTDRVELTGLSLPRLVAVAAGAGDPPGIEPPGPVTDFLPVPVDPGEC
jgi:hypothetical protein